MLCGLTRLISISNLYHIPHENLSQNFLITAKLLLLRLQSTVEAKVFPQYPWDKDHKI